MVVLFAAAMVITGQSQERRNNPYAPSPAGNSRSMGAPASSEVPLGEIASIRSQGKSEERPAIFEPVIIYTTKETKPLALTEIYKVGINDVLHIRLRNTTSGSDYYTVRADGTIDFPLAGDNVHVDGLTVEDIKTKLARSIKLFADPKVEVAIREYASHKISVSGSVGNPGEKYLRREAVPFFVIRAEAITDPASSTVKITNAKRESLTYDLHDPQTDNILVFPGSTVEFTIEKSLPSATYYVTGKRVTNGEKQLTLGLTLLKAVIEANNSGDEPKKAMIRRKNKDGKLSTLEFDLKAIKTGKIADPTIEAGDILDIRN
jgi:protein involved in polysaccharide export with SLBB domain